MLVNRVIYSVGYTVLSSMSHCTLQPSTQVMFSYSTHNELEGRTHCDLLFRQNKHNGVTQTMCAW